MGAKDFIAKGELICTKKCGNSAGLTPKTVTVDFSARKHDVPENFQKSILDRFREDDVGNVCRKDKNVLLLGKKLWAKSVKKKESC